MNTRRRWVPRSKPAAATYCILWGSEFHSDCSTTTTSGPSQQPLFSRYAVESEHRRYPSSIYPDLELRDVDSGFVHVRCPMTQESFNLHGHADSLVIAVDGACPHNGNGATASGIGVYFGPGNGNNMSARIPDELSGFAGHTNNRAEIYAAIVALKIARDLFDSQGARAKCKSIVVKSDSAYVVESVGGGRNGEQAHILKWISNGFRSVKNKPVKNLMLWSELGHELVYLRKMGFSVQFWHVPRHMNRDADKLANEALREECWLNPELVKRKDRDISAASQYWWGSHEARALSKEIELLQFLERLEVVQELDQAEVHTHLPS
ncbi:hypothetical protein K456DRAFT_1930854 [Colletotrichum gloeosporioides 23]|nr:hypothetical protein K456DRAFT_1930854 [Colletotrichum gloeosporioides 23]